MQKALFSRRYCSASAAKLTWQEFPAECLLLLVVPVHVTSVLDPHRGPPLRLDETVSHTSTTIRRASGSPWLQTQLFLRIPRWLPGPPDGCPTSTTSGWWAPRGRLPRSVSCLRGKSRSPGSAPRSRSAC